ncbi:MAG: hypothetical protein PVG51_07490 [Desulfosarcina sp.]|jgi:hypothetical protein
MQPTQSSDHLTGGRRMGRDRREYAYACCIPERRSGLERRSGIDRRQSSRVFSMMVKKDPDPSSEPVGP